ncbi:hypothetical protein GCM10009785_11660 [Brooklawnia cerclae]|uniref:DUF624 domain-containing protein n=1 Tax=Brooklawnia cerclae TaxID=349934 RepID=A0ABX0SKR8_9ACTN|nr:hypothetical protein [Brooklawnia cerclae]NIH58606.1 hypothetical protein [Brooklawnia cerclae]
MTARAREVARRRHRPIFWWLDYLAYPAMAGVAFVVLALGVVTWLPALAAAGRALDGWRTNGDTSVLTGTFRAFRRYARVLMPHAVVSTLALALLAIDVIFLSGRSGPVALALFMICLGLVLVLLIYHVALAVVAATRPDESVGEWIRGALWFAFGSVTRGTALLGAIVAAPICSLPIPLGPLLFSATAPVLVGLLVLDRTNPQ